MIWTGSLILVGFFATEAIKRVQQWVEYLVLGLSVVFIIFIITIGRRILRKGLSLDDEEAGELSSK
jgi:membrane protein DedA with SNARE-associated domain